MTTPWLILALIAIGILVYGCGREVKKLVKTCERWYE